MNRQGLYPGAVSGLLPHSMLRVLRIYLMVTTALYTFGVGFTLFPLRDSVTLSDPLGGIIAIVLGVAALGWLAVRPEQASVAVLAACVATPVVMAFHELIAAEYLCMVAAMFLAMYLRAAYSQGRAWLLIGLLTGGCVLALWLAPAPKYLTSYLVVAVAIPAAAESFGLLTRTLLTAACTDPLTGAFNRAGWELATSALLDRRRSPRRAVTVIALDIDDFKSINDTRGHSAGDEHLVGHTRRCARLLPRDSVLARMGGDEFAICVVHEDGERGESSGAAGDSATVDALLTAMRRELPDTTVGTATAPTLDVDIADLHIRADLDLTAAKQSRLRARHEVDDATAE